MTKNKAPGERMEMLRIAKEASNSAREENRRMGIASPFAIEGRIFYELPDGSITEEEPDYKKSKLETAN